MKGKENCEVTMGREGCNSPIEYYIYTSFLRTCTVYYILCVLCVMPVH